MVNGDAVTVIIQSFGLIESTDGNLVRVRLIDGRLVGVDRNMVYPATPSIASTIREQVEQSKQASGESCAVSCAVRSVATERSKAA